MWLHENHFKHCKLADKMLFILTVGIILIVELECRYYNESYWPNFTWVPDDPILDCVVAITDNYKPGNLGVFIAKNLLVTSENAQFKNFYYPSYTVIFVPNGSFDKKRGYAVKRHIGDYKGKKAYWVYWGSESDNSPVHDVMFMIADIEVKRNFDYGRHPYSLSMAGKGTIEEPSGWLTGAFALVDKDHVNDSTKLIPVFYDEPVLVDCDEWFPRYWGYFICIRNLDNYPVIESGAPLIQNHLLFGVASFTMKRGRESIFAFTDLREYQGVLGKMYELYEKEIKF